MVDIGIVASIGVACLFIVGITVGIIILLVYLIKYCCKKCELNKLRNTGVHITIEDGPNWSNYFYEPESRFGA